VIETVAGTLAPFAGREKPQLFPWLAASLIKNSRWISELRLRRAACGTARSYRRAIPGIAVMPIFIGFLYYCSATKAPGLLTQTGIRWDCTRGREAAHIRSRPALAVSICPDRHNFATELFANSGRRRDIWPAAMAPDARNARNTKRIARSLPAEELGKRWRFFSTYADVQSSPVLRQQFLRTLRDTKC
jgi:hypothetical protein